MIAGLDLGFKEATDTLLQPASVRGDLAVIMMLSDGVPDQGSQVVTAHAAKLAAELRASSPSCSTPLDTTRTMMPCCWRDSPKWVMAVPLYYYLRSEEDVPAAAGDCLGAMQSLILSGLELSARPLTATGEHCPSWTSSILGFPESGLAAVGSLRSNAGRAS